MKQLMKILCRLVLIIGALLASAAHAQDVQFKNFSEIVVTGEIDHAASSNNFALIIYNAEYTHPKISDLPTTKHDAQAIKQLLSGLGYNDDKIVMIANPSKSEIEEAAADVADKISSLGTDSSQASVVIYYSGHGVTFNSAPGNYIVPSDMNPEVQSLTTAHQRILKRTISLEEVIATVKSGNPGGIVVFYDACRDAPFQNFEGETKNVAGSTSFVASNAVKGTAIFYAAGEKQTALAKLGPNDDNQMSVFTRVLVDELSRTPSLELSTLHRNLNARVARLASRERELGPHPQEPAFKNELSYSQIERLTGRREFCLAKVQRNGQAACYSPVSAAPADPCTTAPVQWRNIKKTETFVSAFSDQFAKCPLYHAQAEQWLVFYALKLA